MPDPTATKEYVINNLPIVSGDITPVSFPLDGGNQFNGYKVGKLYFGIYLSAGPQNGISSGGPDTIASADRLAFLLGETVNTYYADNVALAPGNIVAWNGAIWAPSGSSALTLVGFLIN